MDPIVIGREFCCTVEIEPIPKSTKRPPRLPKAVMFKSLPSNDPLVKTLRYQRELADLFIRAGLPQFDPFDLIALSCIINRRRNVGDLKNYVASIEDALQFAGIIPNDKRITRHSSLLNLAETPSVWVSLSLDDRMVDFDWYKRWFNLPRKTILSHWERRMRGA